MSPLLALKISNLSQDITVYTCHRLVALSITNHENGTYITTNRSNKINREKTQLCNDTTLSYFVFCEGNNYSVQKR